MPLYTYSTFTPNAVRPVECLNEGWALIKDQYWLFVAMSLVAILIGNLAPLGILMPPMMCGLYLAIFRRMRGQAIEFEVLFKGFDFFGEGIVAMVLHVVPIVVIMVPLGVVMMLGTILLAPNGGDGGVGAIIILAIVSTLVVMPIVLFVSVISAFAYPLIVERKLSGIDAVKLSARAGWANFWGLLGLLLLTAGLGILGLFFCYIGAFLVFPVSFAATACAYRRVFGLEAAPSPYPPPPPGSFV